MASKDSIKQTLIVAISLCLVCSIVVSTAAVLLKPIQIANRNLDKQTRILSLVGLLDKNADISEQFEKLVEPRIIELDSGRFVDNMDFRNFDQRKLTKDPATSIALSQSEDVAGIKRRAEYAIVYLIKKNDSLKYVVLPVHGYGLWSTMYGFIALESDLNTIHGISFYEHAETPGLGGEIDNPEWQALWSGKEIYADDSDPDPDLRVIKGNVTPDTANAEYKIDGLAGATLTANGVSRMMQFWFDDMGYLPFIERFKNRG